MIPARCNACDRFALDLTGQSEHLDSYFLGDGEPPPSSAGSWHRKCLRESGLGAAWHDARVRNFVDVRGYASVARTGSWTVIAREGRGQRIALSTDGALVELPRSSEIVKSEAGVCYRERSAEYNLHLPDAALIKAMQAALVRDGACPMSMMFDQLGLWPFLDAPEVLGDARFVYDPELGDVWGAEWLCAASEYNVLVPDELAPFCV